MRTYVRTHASIAPGKEKRDKDSARVSPATPAAPAYTPTGAGATKASVTAELLAQANCRFETADAAHGCRLFWQADFTR